MKKTPSENSEVSSAAVWIANRVLPAPPGARMVSNLVSERIVWAFSSSSCRPTNSVSWTGRLLGTASNEFNEGKWLSWPSRFSW